MAGAHRPRRILLETLTELCRAVRSQAYKVKRGPVNWVTWDFTDYPRGIAILQDSGSLLPSNSTHGMRPTQLSIEIFCKMPTAAEALGADEALAEEMMDDVEDILLDLVRASHQSEPVIFNLSLPSVVYAEHYDAHVGVQGFVFTFQVTY